MQTTIKQDKFKTRKDIFLKGLPDFERFMQSEYGDNIEIEQSGTITTVRVWGRAIIVDHQAGEIEYTADMQLIANALKRSYSASVIKTVAQGTRIKSKFNLKQTGQRDFTLQRRRP
jgi:hypothetical protein